MEKRLIVAEADDWSGIYLDDKLIFEAHSILPIKLLEIALNAQPPITSIDDVECAWVDIDWLDELGNLPKDISEVIWET